MPELPEVETVRRGLERTIVGKTIESVEVRVPKIFADEQSTIDQNLIGATVVAAERRAKVLLIRFSNDWTLAIHLKMTGQLVVRTQNLEPGSRGFVGGHPERAYEQPLPHKHTHVTIQFTDGMRLYYNDLRKFGWMKLFPGKNHESRIMNHESQTIEDFLDRLTYGPEPLSEEFTLEGFRSALKKRRIPIKTVLLDQKVVAGIGNIYADEALFRAQINPKRKASALKPAEIERLHAAIPTVLQFGIEHGGTTFNAYRNVEGTSGKMRDYLKVYGREDLPCLRDGDTREVLRSDSSRVKEERITCPGIIKRIKLGQRSCHFCPRCQR